MTRAGLTLAALLAASPLLAQAPPAAPPAGGSGPDQPADRPGVPDRHHPPAAPPVRRPHRRRRTCRRPAAARPVPAGRRPRGGRADGPGTAGPPDRVGEGHAGGRQLLLQGRDQGPQEPGHQEGDRRTIGEIMCLKPNMARMRLEKKPAAGPEGGPERLRPRTSAPARRSTSTTGTAKVVTEYKLHNGGVGDNLLLEFMSGTLKADRRGPAVRPEAAQAGPELRLPGDQAAAAARPGRVRDDDPGPVPAEPAEAGHLAYLPRTVVMRKRRPGGDVGLPAADRQRPGDRAKDHFQFVPVPRTGWKIAAGPAAVAGRRPGTPTGQPRVARPMGP